MQRCLKMMKLDYFTMKPYVVSYLSLVFSLLVFGFIASNVIVVCITAGWFMALMSSTLFSIQEKCNLDRLYGSVSIGVEDIVAGRYLYVLLTYLLAFIFAVGVYAGIGLFLDKGLAIRDILLGFGLSFLIFSAITGMQIPLFFKMGYTKAIPWSLISFIAVALGGMAIFIPPPAVMTLLTSRQSIFAVSCLLISGLIQWISYKISVGFYKKRR